ncbi:hypothetical protein RCL1_004313 [Eukaryota sp. TZLM3-RCL]
MQGVGRSLVPFFLEDDIVNVDLVPSSEEPLIIPEHKLQARTWCPEGYFIDHPSIASEPSPAPSRIGSKSSAPTQQKIPLDLSLVSDKKQPKINRALFADCLADQAPDSSSLPDPMAPSFVAPSLEEIGTFVQKSRSLGRSLDFLSI